MIYIIVSSANDLSGSTTESKTTQESGEWIKVLSLLFIHF